MNIMTSSSSSSSFDSDGHHYDHRLSDDDDDNHSHTTRQHHDNSQQQQQQSSSSVSWSSNVEPEHADEPLHSAASSSSSSSSSSNDKASSNNDNSQRSRDRGRRQRPRLEASEYSTSTIQQQQDDESSSSSSSHGGGDDGDDDDDTTRHGQHNHNSSSRYESFRDSQESSSYSHGSRSSYREHADDDDDNNNDDHSETSCPSHDESGKSSVSRTSSSNSRDGACDSVSEPESLKTKSCKSRNVSDNDDYLGSRQSRDSLASSSSRSNGHSSVSGSAGGDVTSDYDDDDDDDDDEQDDSAASPSRGSSGQGQSARYHDDVNPETSHQADDPSLSSTTLPHASSAGSSGDNQLASDVHDDVDIAHGRSAMHESQSSSSAAETENGVTVEKTTRLANLSAKDVSEEAPLRDSLPEQQDESVAQQHQQSTSRLRPAYVIQKAMTNMRGESESTLKATPSRSLYTKSNALNSLPISGQLQGDAESRARRIANDEAITRSDSASSDAEPAADIPPSLLVDSTLTGNPATSRASQQHDHFPVYSTIQSSSLAVTTTASLTTSPVATAPPFTNANPDLTELVYELRQARQEIQSLRERVEATPPPTLQLESRVERLVHELQSTRQDLAQIKQRQQEEREETNRRNAVGQRMSPETARMKVNEASAEDGTRFDDDSDVQVAYSANASSDVDMSAYRKVPQESFSDPSLERSIVSQATGAGALTSEQELSLGGQQQSELHHSETSIYLMKNHMDELSPDLAVGEAEQNIRTDTVGSLGEAGAVEDDTCFCVSTHSSNANFGDDNNQHTKDDADITLDLRQRAAMLLARAGLDIGYSNDPASESEADSCQSSVALSSENDEASFDSLGTRDDEASAELSCGPASSSSDNAADINSSESSQRHHAPEVLLPDVVCGGNIGSVENSAPFQSGGHFANVSDHVEMSGSAAFESERRGQSADEGARIKNPTILKGSGIRIAPMRHQEQLLPFRARAMDSEFVVCNNNIDNRQLTYDPAHLSATAHSVVQTTNDKVAAGASADSLNDQFDSVPGLVDIGRDTEAIDSAGDSEDLSGRSITGTNIIPDFRHKAAMLLAQAGSAVVSSDNESSYDCDYAASQATRRSSFVDELGSQSDNAHALQEYAVGKRNPLDDASEAESDLSEEFEAVDSFECLSERSSHRDGLSIASTAGQVTSDDIVPNESLRLGDEPPAFLMAGNEISDNGCLSHSESGSTSPHKKEVPMSIPVPAVLDDCDPRQRAAFLLARAGVAFDSGSSKNRNLGDDYEIRGDDSDYKTSSGREVEVLYAERSINGSNHVAAFVDALNASSRANDVASTLEPSPSDNLPQTGKVFVESDLLGRVADGVDDELHETKAISNGSDSSEASEFDPDNLIFMSDSDAESNDKSDEFADDEGIRESCCASERWDVTDSQMHMNDGLDSDDLVAHDRDVIFPQVASPKSNDVIVVSDSLLISDENSLYLTPLARTSDAVTDSTLDGANTCTHEQDTIDLNEFIFMSDSERNESEVESMESSPHECEGWRVVDAEKSLQLHDEGTDESLFRDASLRQSGSAQYRDLYVESQPSSHLPFHRASSTTPGDASYGSESIRAPAADDGDGSVYSSDSAADLLSVPIYPLKSASLDSDQSNIVHIPNSLSNDERMDSAGLKQRNNCQTSPDAAEGGAMVASNSNALLDGRDVLQDVISLQSGAAKNFHGNQCVDVVSLQSGAAKNFHGNQCVDVDDDGVFFSSDGSGAISHSSGDDEAIAESCADESGLDLLASSIIGSSIGRNDLWSNPDAALRPVSASQDVKLWLTDSPSVDYIPSLVSDDKCTIIDDKNVGKDQSESNEEPSQSVNVNESKLRAQFNDFDEHDDESDGKRQLDGSHSAEQRMAEDWDEKSDVNWSGSHFDNGDNSGISASEISIASNDQSATCYKDENFKQYSIPLDHDAEHLRSLSGDDVGDDDAQPPVSGMELELHRTEAFERICTADKNTSTSLKSSYKDDDEEAHISDESSRGGDDAGAHVYESGNRPVCSHTDHGSGSPETKHEEISFLSQNQSIGDARSNNEQSQSVGSDGPSSADFAHSGSFGSQDQSYAGGEKIASFRSDEHQWKHSTDHSAESPGSDCGTLAIEPLANFDQSSRHDVEVSFGDSQGTNQEDYDPGSSSACAVVEATDIDHASLSHNSALETSTRHKDGDACFDDSLRSSESAYEGESSRSGSAYDNEEGSLKSLDRSIQHDDAANISKSRRSGESDHDSESSRSGSMNEASLELVARSEKTGSSESEYDCQSRNNSTSSQYSSVSDVDEESLSSRGHFNSDNSGVASKDSGSDCLSHGEESSHANENDGSKSVAVSIVKAEDGSRSASDPSAHASKSFSSAASEHESVAASNDVSTSNHESEASLDGSAGSSSDWSLGSSSARERAATTAAAVSLSADASLTAGNDDGRLNDAPQYLGGEQQPVTSDDVAASASSLPMPADEFEAEPSQTETMTTDEDKADPSKPAQDNAATEQAPVSSEERASVTSRMLGRLSKLWGKSSSTLPNAADGQVAGDPGIDDAEQQVPQVFMPEPSDQVRLHESSQSVTTVSPADDVTSEILTCSRANRRLVDKDQIDHDDDADDGDQAAPLALSDNEQQQHDKATTAVTVNKGDKIKKRDTLNMSSSEYESSSSDDSDDSSAAAAANQQLRRSTQQEAPAVAATTKSDSNDSDGSESNSESESDSDSTRRQSTNSDSSRSDNNIQFTSDNIHDDDDDGSSESDSAGDQNDETMQQSRHASGNNSSSSSIGDISSVNGDDDDDSASASASSESQRSDHCDSKDDSLSDDGDDASSLESDAVEMDNEFDDGGGVDDSRSSHVDDDNDRPASESSVASSQSTRSSQSSKSNSRCDESETSGSNSDDDDHREAVDDNDDDNHSDASGSSHSDSGGSSRPESQSNGRSDRSGTSTSQAFDASSSSDSDGCNRITPQSERSDQSDSSNQDSVAGDSSSDDNGDEPSAAVGDNDSDDNTHSSASDCSKGDNDSDRSNRIWPQSESSDRLDKSHQNFGADSSSGSSLGVQSVTSVHDNDSDDENHSNASRRNGASDSDGSNHQGSQSKASSHSASSVEESEAGSSISESKCDDAGDVVDDKFASSSSHSASSVEESKSGSSSNEGNGDEQCRVADVGDSNYDSCSSVSVSSNNSESSQEQEHFIRTPTPTMTPTMNDEHDDESGSESESSHSRKVEVDDQSFSHGMGNFAEGSSSQLHSSRIANASHANAKAANDSDGDSSAASGAEAASSLECRQSPGMGEPAVEEGSDSNYSAHRKEGISDSSSSSSSSDGSKSVSYQGSNRPDASHSQDEASDIYSPVTPRSAMDQMSPDEYGDEDEDVFAIAPKPRGANSLTNSNSNNNNGLQSEAMEMFVLEDVDSSNSVDGDSYTILLKRIPPTALNNNVAGDESDSDGSSDDEKNALVTVADFVAPAFAPDKKHNIGELDSILPMGGQMPETLVATDIASDNDSDSQSSTENTNIRVMSLNAILPSDACTGDDQGLLTVENSSVDMPCLSTVAPQSTGEVLRSWTKNDDSKTPSPTSRESANTDITSPRPKVPISNGGSILASPDDISGMPDSYISTEELQSPTGLPIEAGSVSGSSTDSSEVYVTPPRGAGVASEDFSGSSVEGSNLFGTPPQALGETMKGGDESSGCSEIENNASKQAYAQRTMLSTSSVSNTEEGNEADLSKMNASIGKSVPVSSDPSIVVTKSDDEGPSTKPGVDDTFIPGSEAIYSNPSAAFIMETGDVSSDNSDALSSASKGRVESASSQAGTGRVAASVCTESESIDPSSAAINAGESLLPEIPAAESKSESLSSHSGGAGPLEVTCLRLQTPIGNDMVTNDSDHSEAPSMASADIAAIKAQTKAFEKDVSGHGSSSSSSDSLISAASEVSSVASADIAALQAQSRHLLLGAMSVGSRASSGSIEDTFNNSDTLLEDELPIGKLPSRPPTSDAGAPIVPRPGRSLDDASPNDEINANVIDNDGKNSSTSPSSGFRAILDANKVGESSSASESISSASLPKLLKSEPCCAQPPIEETTKVAPYNRKLASIVDDTNVVANASEDLIFQSNICSPPTEDPLHALTSDTVIVAKVNERKVVAEEDRIKSDSEDDFIENYQLVTPTTPNMAPSAAMVEAVAGRTEIDQTVKLHETIRTPPKKTSHSRRKKVTRPPHVVSIQKDSNARSFDRTDNADGMSSLEGSPVGASRALTKRKVLGNQKDDSSASSGPVIGAAVKAGPKRRRRSPKHSPKSTGTAQQRRWLGGLQQAIQERKTSTSALWKDDEVPLDEAGIDMGIIQPVLPHLSNKALSQAQVRWPVDTHTPRNQAKRPENDHRARLQPTGSYDSYDVSRNIPIDNALDHGPVCHIYRNPFDGSVREENNSNIMVPAVTVNAASLPEVRKDLLEPVATTATANDIGVNDELNKLISLSPQDDLWQTLRNILLNSSEKDPVPPLQSGDPPGYDMLSLKDEENVVEDLETAELRRAIERGAQQGTEDNDFEEDIGALYFGGEFNEANAGDENEDWDEEDPENDYSNDGSESEEDDEEFEDEPELVAADDDVNASTPELVSLFKSEDSDDTHRVEHPWIPSGSDDASPIVASSSAAMGDSAPQMLHDIENGNAKQESEKWVNEFDLPRRKRKRSAAIPFLLCIICFLLLAFIVVLPVLLTRQQQDDTDAMVMSPSPSIMPSQSPTLRGTPTIRPPPTLPSAATPPPSVTSATATMQPSLSPTLRPTQPISPTFEPSILAPLQPSPALTTLPTIERPTTDPVGSPWLLVGGPFRGETDSSLGTSVSLSNSYLIAGARGGNGIVETYQYDDTISEWTMLAEVTGDEQGSLFGSSVALRPLSGAIPGFIVGAPGMMAVASNTLFGAASYYELQSSTAWEQIGSLLRGDEDVYAIREAFGFSVAVSANRILASGAPFSSTLNIAQRGRVYTFKWNTNVNDWTPLTVYPVAGDSEGALLGSAVDISTDGAVMIAGGPGRNAGDGYAVVLAFASNRWQPIATLEAPVSSLEGFGSSVVIIDPYGDVVAIGGPAYQNGRGVIRVYERQVSDGTYAQLGQDIVGDEFSEDALGTAGTVSGTIVGSTGSIVVLAATSSGTIRRYEWLGGSSWQETVPEYRTSLQSIRAVSLSEDATIFAAGGMNQVSVYALDAKSS